jgi:hypothetical protein
MWDFFWSNFVNSDCVFTIGDTHQVCQDYARAISTSDNQIILVADGCSGSKDSDFGSRIVANIAYKLLDDYEFGTAEYFKAIAITARAMAHDMGLPKESIDTTLLMARHRKDLGTDAFMYGDGALVIKRKDGHKLIVQVEYPTGYPSYISYIAHAYREDLWIRLTTAASPPFPVTKFFVLDPSGNSIGVEPDKHNFGIKYCNIENVSFMLDGATAEYESITLFSDGISSFYYKNDTGACKPIPLLDILREILRFKNFNGEFVKRRVQRFLKDAEDRRWFHYDDLAMATIYFG